VNFIERWLGVSPDGGDGTLEMLYIGVGVLAIVVFASRYWIARRLVRGSTPNVRRS
jgi:hypothetical protein